MSGGTFMKSSKLNFQSTFIRAGAGAGKTTQLISTFFNFLDEYRHNYPDKWPKIVITTFTRKATQEIKERLLLAALKKGRTDYVEYINKRSKVHISTIHGVLNIFLNRYIDAIGFNSELKISNDLQQNKISKKILKSILKSNAEFMDLLETFQVSDLLQILNKATLFYFQDEGQLQIINKDKVTSDLKLRLEHWDKDLSDILAQLGSITQASWIEYSHFIQRFQKQLNMELNQNPFLGVSSQFFSLYENRPKKPGFRSKTPIFDESINDLIDMYFKANSEYLTTVDTVEFINSFCDTNRRFFDLLHLYAKQILDHKKNTGSVTIGDLELISLKLIQNRPDAAIEFSKLFDLFMVDEYQDTSPLQIELLNALIGDNYQFIVGDPQQSIYLFRGARSEVFNDKQKKVKNEGFEIKNLNTNYRSDPALMTFINDVLNQFSNQFEPLKPKTSDYLDINKPTVGYYYKTDNEYLTACYHIAHLLNQGVPASAICVLFSKNKDVFEFPKFAQKYNIAVQPQIAAGFDRKREINDLIFYLKFLVNPFDDHNLIGLIRSPWFKATDQDILNIRSKNLNSVPQSLWQQMSLDQTLKDDYVCLSHLLDVYKSQGLMRAVFEFFNKTDFLNSSYFMDTSGQREANIWKFIADIKENSAQADFIVNEYLSQQFMTLQTDLTSNLSEGIPLFSNDRVTCMTIHSSKGLEFPHVIVGGITQSLRPRSDTAIVYDEKSKILAISAFNEDEAKFKNIPWAKNIKNQFFEREMSEFERLFYVATTRAEKTLTFIADMTVRSYNGSWFKQLNWPEDGEHEFSNYKIISENINQLQLNPLVKNENVSIQIKGTYQKIDINKQKSTSVTEMLNTPLVQSDQETTLKDTDYLNLFKADKGTQLHKLFESLKYADRQDVLLQSADDEKLALNYLFSQSEIPFVQLLTDGFAEWGFGLKTTQGLIQGQIDLWGQVGQTVYILDYKTGSSDYADKAFSQLNLYAAALKQMGFLLNGVNEVKLVVVYPFEEKILLKSIILSEVQTINQLLQP